MIYKPIYNRTTAPAKKKSEPEEKKKKKPKKKKEARKNHTQIGATQAARALGRRDPSREPQDGVTQAASPRAARPKPLSLSLIW